jgi:hypothetical protein
VPVTETPVGVPDERGDVVIMAGAIVRPDSQIIAKTSVAGRKLKGLFPNAKLSSKFYTFLTIVLNFHISGHYLSSCL